MAKRNRSRHDPSLNDTEVMDLEMELKLTHIQRTAEDTLEMDLQMDFW